MKGLLNICSPLKQKHGKRVERFWSECSWHTPTMKIHQGGNSAGSRLNIWASSKDRLGWGGGGVTKKMRQTAHFSHFGTLLLVNTTISIWFVCLCENYRPALGPFKKKKKRKNQQADPFISKRKKSSIQGEKAYVVEWGRAKKKKKSPKDAMHLVVVLWIIVSFSFYYKFKVSL